MRYDKMLLLAASLLAVAACDDDGVSVISPSETVAKVRFINAVPDTGTVDLVFVDRVENLPTMKGVGLHSTSGLYQQVQAGTRSVRIFPFSTNLELTKIRLIDTQIQLNAGARYTLVYAGRASADSPEAERHRLVQIDDPETLPTPGTGQIAIQALHVAVGVGNVDLYVVPVESVEDPTPADLAGSSVAVLTNIPYLGKGAYVTVPARPAGDGNLYRFVVTEAGSTTELFAVTANQPGIPATPGQLYGAQPGVQISGSVLTAVIASGSVPGTRESTADNQDPTVFLAIDKTLDP